MLGYWLTPMPKVIEEAVDEDVGTLSEIHGRCFARVWSEDEISALASGAGVFILVARRASPFGTRRPLGFAILRVAADEAEVLTIAVDPSHRGRGYGRLLMEAATRRLYADRVEALFLEVDAANRPAVALYEALGFKSVGKRKGYYAEAEDSDGVALVMRCDLR